MFGLFKKKSNDDDRYWQHLPASNDEERGYMSRAAQVRQHNTDDDMPDDETLLRNHRRIVQGDMAKAKKSKAKKAFVGGLVNAGRVAVGANKPKKTVKKPAAKKTTKRRTIKKKSDW